MTTSDDPFARLELAADELVQSLSSLDPAPPGAVVDAAKDLRRAIGRTSKALQHRRAADLRSALDHAERRSQDAELARERAVTGERIAVLEREVEALLAPSRSEARSFYESRIGELGEQVATLRRQRRELESRLSAPAAEKTEMERSRDAALAAAAHADEQTLLSELASVERKLAAVAGA